MKKNRLHVGHFVHANMLLDNVVQINYKVDWPLKIWLENVRLFRPNMQAVAHLK